ncbi:MAG: alpha/beta hydrolase, partial [Cyanobacteria bacterium P01_H01_bin.15]
IDFLKSSENEDEFKQWFDFIYLGMKSHKPQPIVFAKVLTDEELRNLNVPTLFLTGENEIIYSVKRVRSRLKSLAPHVQIEIIKNAGHDLPMAKPQEVNYAILKFLSNESTDLIS